MLNIKSELLQEVADNYVYDTSVKVEGSIETLLGETSTSLCKLIETLTEDLDIPKDKLVETQVVLLESIYSITREILEKADLDDITSYKI